jgi:hypothetical protein
LAIAVRLAVAVTDHGVLPTSSMSPRTMDARATEKNKENTP